MSQGRGSARCATIMAALLICLLLVYIEIVDATTFTVGDSGGWSFNMASWAKGKRFKAGDTLGKFSLSPHSDLSCKLNFQDLKHV